MGLVTTFSPEEDFKVIEIIIFNNGAIYGGYLRDSIAGEREKIKDIDVVLSELYRDKFHNEMTEEGYEVKFNASNFTFVYKKPGEKVVEAYFVQDDPADTVMGPESEPDYDVNLLAWNGESLYIWTDPNRQIYRIISHIIEKKTVEISHNPEREEKILSKGYTIIGSDDSYL